MQNCRSFVVSLIAFCGLVGCGSSAKSLCDRSGECIGWNDSELQACYDSAEDSELDAQQADCLSEYNEVVACYDDTFECTNNKVTTEQCTGELVNLLECGLASGNDGSGG